MSVLIRGAGFGLPCADLVFDIARDSGEGLSIFVSDQARDKGIPPNQWIIDVRCKTNRGFGYVGRVLTTPPNGNIEPQQRLVAIANVPGAIAWQASFRGARGQRANIDLACGDGTGSVRGNTTVRPRPRDYARALLRSVTQFDTVLFDLSVADTSDPATPIPAGGLFVQFFNKASAPVAGDIPIDERNLLSHGSFQQSFDSGQEQGDPRYRLGLAWGLSSTPGVFTPAAGGQVISVTSVLG